MYRECWEISNNKGFDILLAYRKDKLVPGSSDVIDELTYNTNGGL